MGTPRNDADRPRDDQLNQLNNDDNAKKDDQANSEGRERQVLYSTRYFGKGLRSLRHSYGTRMTAQDPFAPAIRARISTAALVECMRRAGYAIKQAAFNEIEHGVSAPREAPEFLAAVRNCLRLTEDEVNDLAMRLAFDILYARFGDWAEKLLERRAEWDREPVSPADDS